MNIQKDKIKNMLLVRRNNIGDMICAIPMFRTLRKEFPDAHMTVLAEESNAEIIQGASFIDDVIIYKKRPGIYANKYLGYYKLLKQNNKYYDLIITAKVGFSSLLAFISLVSGAEIRMGCIPDTWHPLQFCYNFPVKNCKQWKSLRQVEGLLALIKTIGIEHTVKDIKIEIAPSSKDKASDFFQKNGIQRDKNIVVSNISNNKPENTWPLERFKETANVLSKQYKTTYIITSSPSDKDKALRLSKEINNALYFETHKVMDFAALVSESALLICGEGGAMHIGAGVDTPTISLWGKYRPVKWIPYGEKQFVLKKGKHVNTISASDVLEIIKENGLLK